MSAKLGVIGYPIGHSISPVFQQAGLDHLGIDASYQAWEVKPDEVGEFVGELRNPEVLGINVTVPHKEAVIPFLDQVDEGAREAGAVNTIVHRDGQLTGYNTDSHGFLQALRDARDFSCGGRRVLVLGAGGAARGVVLALIREEVAELVIANRTLARGERLASIARERGINSRAIEQLEARLKSVQAAQITSTIEFDDSQLSRAKILIRELNKQLDVRTKLMDAEGKFSGLIPVESAKVPVEVNIAKEIDDYFGRKTDSQDESAGVKSASL